MLKFVKKTIQIQLSEKKYATTINLIHAVTEKGNAGLLLSLISSNARATGLLNVALNVLLSTECCTSGLN